MKYKLSEPLQVTHYRNGDEILEVTDNEKWVQTKEPARCWYNNNPKTGVMLYNWYAVNDKRGLAPEGWHVPSDAEWEKILKNKKIKEELLSALPGGHRYNFSGYFYSMGSHAYFWSATEYSSAYAWCRYLNFSIAEVYRSYSNKRNGFSVRCVRGK